MDIKKDYIISLLSNYKHISDYQMKHHSNIYSKVKVRGKIEVLKEILKHQEEKETLNK